MGGGGGVTLTKKHRKYLAPKKKNLGYVGTAAVSVIPLCGAIPRPPHGGDRHFLAALPPLPLGGTGLTCGGEYKGGGDTALHHQAFFTATNRLTAMHTCCAHCFPQRVPLNLSFVVHLSFCS